MNSTQPSVLSSTKRNFLSEGPVSPNYVWSGMEYTHPHCNSKDSKVEIGRKSRCLQVPYNFDTHDASGPYFRSTKKKLSRTRFSGTTVIYIAKKMMRSAGHKSAASSCLSSCNDLEVHQTPYLLYSITESVKNLLPAVPLPRYCPFSNLFQTGTSTFGQPDGLSLALSKAFGYE